MAPRGSERPEPAPLKGRTVLAIFAHPDDESLTCGGTLFRFAELGARTVVVCASHGELGEDRSSPNQNAGPESAPNIAHTRAQELAAAAAVLGLAAVWLLNYPDGSLRWSDTGSLRAAITSAVQRFSPSLVVTFGEDGLYWHPDHIAVHEQTVMALRSLGRSAPPLYGSTMPEGAMRHLYDAATRRGWQRPVDGLWSLDPDAWGAHAPAATVDVDVRPVLQAKIAAIGCHASQLGPSHPLALLDDGEKASCLGHELFHLIPTGARAPSPNLFGYLS